MAMRRIDCHVHLVGDGSSGTGCWLRTPNPVRWLGARFLVRASGLPVSVLKNGLDNAYAENLVRRVRESSLDAVALLAMDLPRSDDGQSLESKAIFYVPNERVLELGSKHPEIIPACSIHPGRPDAMEELEKCIEGGAKVMKLLPNCHNVNCSDPDYSPFWERMAKAGMVFLAHTGGELTVPVLNKRYADPRALRLPAERGVVTIAAHAAGRSGLLDRDYTGELVKMFDEFSNLYADNSALCTFNRWRTIKKLFPDKVMARVLHGSDFPVPSRGFGPWVGGHLKWRDHRVCARNPNALERDAALKKAMGFPEETFTRLDGLLG
ncbi:MAG: amidohydrolase family protein [Opitutales bacterium]